MTVPVPPTAPARPSPALDSLSLAAILVTIVFWASSFAGIRAGLEAFSPGHLTLYRFLVASAALGIFALFTRIPLPPLPDLARIALLSFSGITLYHICLNYGEVSVPAGTASLIIAAGPVITALLATRFGNERLNLVGWIGTLISFSGVALIVLGKGESVNFTQGALLILAAALFTSLYFVFQKPLLARMKPLHFTVWSLMLGTIPMLIFLPGFGSELARAPLAAHVAVIYIGLFPAALAYITWSFALSRVGANTTASFLYVSPVLAILIGWLWLNEVPGVISLVGGAISIAGVILVNTLGKPRKA
ncbi:DMT family transporter [Deinococcus sp. QL22]|uniref:DMT family transporter n=1 Tax=Deinococcus sp. QL22 TaxID=2939437 RepID=UPI0020172BE9|nr:DMT family transporter [Deinococcus sp. QL22]UQN07313.1 DMT family transporter [Deinococcus sp. QL22]